MTVYIERRHMTMCRVSVDTHDYVQCQCGHTHDCAVLVWIAVSEDTLMAKCVVSVDTHDCAVSVWTHS
jgi:hypothetical protein